MKYFSVFEFQTAWTATADTAKLMHGKTFTRGNRFEPVLALGNHSCTAACEKNPALHKNTQRLLVLPLYSQ